MSALITDIQSQEIVSNFTCPLAQIIELLWKEGVFGKYVSSSINRNNNNIVIPILLL